jgi:dihydrofolate reductase
MAKAIAGMTMSPDGFVNDRNGSVDRLYSDLDALRKGGAHTMRELISAGLVDEIEIGIVPVLLGDGLRLFERLSTGPIELEQM